MNAIICFSVHGLTCFASNPTYNNATRTERSGAMKLYLDIFFLFNTGMNLVILLAESMMRRRRVRWRRMLLASAVGGTLACILTVTGIHKYRLLFFLLCGLAEIPIIRIAFGKTTGKAFITNAIVFYLLSCLFGGILTQVEALTAIPMTGVLILGIAIIILALFHHFLPAVHCLKERTSNYYSVRLTYHGKTIQSLALLDTGNQLRDPFTGEPVLIGNRDFLQALWSEEPILRIIPFRSVGRDAGTLKAFQADSLFIECQNSWKRVDHPWVAIWSGMVSGEGEYEIILHPDMLI